MSTITKGLINRGDLALYDGVNSTVSRIDSTGGTITELPIGNVVDVLAVYGADNTATNRATIANAIARVGSATVTFVFSPGTWTIASNLTIPENIAVLMYPGAVFSIDTGITLTINGPLLVGNHNVFEGAGTVSGVLAKALSRGVSVIIFGAKADAGITDCLTAFNNARTMARANGTPVYIPGSASYYSLSAVYLMDSSQDALAGDGMYESVLYVNHAGVGVRITGSQWMLRDFSVMGKSTSTNGIQIEGYRGHAYNVWAGDVGTYAWYLKGAMSSNFYNCGCDNNGFHPRSIVDIGFEDYHWYLGDGINNDIRFYGCFANGGGSLGGVRIGNGAGSVQSIRWYGGLMQGNNAKFLYIQGGEACHVTGVHMEEAQDGTSWGVTLDACSGTRIDNIYITGDIRLINGSSLCVVEDILVCSAVFIDGTCEHGNIVRNVWYRANASGPGGGQIKDESGLARLEDNKANNTAHHSVGNNCHKTSEVIFRSNMEAWYTTPSLMPCGFLPGSGVTVTKEATIKQTGSYSMKCVSAAANNYVSLYLPTEVSHLNGHRVTIRANIYNVTTPALCTIYGVTASGSATQGGGVWMADAWCRMELSLIVPATGGVEYRFVFGDAGTFYINDVMVMTDATVEPPVFDTLDTIAIPEMTPDNSYWQPVILHTPAGTAITDFKRSVAGKPFTLLLTGARTVVHGATIKLENAQNFVGATGDSITMLYNPSDNITYELCRTQAATQTYSATNVVTDRSYDANATSVDELADVLGTLIADLRARNLIL